MNQERKIFEPFPPSKEYLKEKYPDLSVELGKSFEDAAHYIHLTHGSEDKGYVGPFDTESAATEWLEHNDYRFDAEGGASANGIYAVARTGDAWKGIIGHQIVSHATSNYYGENGLSADESNRQFAEQQIHEIKISRP